MFWLILFVFNIIFKVRFNIKCHKWLFILLNICFFKGLKVMLNFLWTFIFITAMNIITELTLLIIIIMILNMTLITNFSCWKILITFLTFEIYDVIYIYGFLRMICVTNLTLRLIWLTLFTNHICHLLNWLMLITIS